MREACRKTLGVRGRMQPGHRESSPEGNRREYADRPHHCEPACVHACDWVAARFLTPSIGKASSTHSARSGSIDFLFLFFLVEVVELVVVVEVVVLVLLDVDVVDLLIDFVVDVFVLVFLEFVVDVFLLVIEFVEFFVFLVVEFFFELLLFLGMAGIQRGKCGRPAIPTGAAGEEVWSRVASSPVRSSIDPVLRPRRFQGEFPRIPCDADGQFAPWSIAGRSEGRAIVVVNVTHHCQVSKICGSRLSMVPVLAEAVERGGCCRESCMKFVLRNRRHPGGRSLKRPDSADVLLPKVYAQFMDCERHVVEIAGGFGSTSPVDQIRRTTCLLEADRAMASIRRTVSSACVGGTAKRGAVQQGGHEIAVDRLRRLEGKGT